MKTKKEIEAKAKWLDEFETRYIKLAHSAYHNGFYDAIRWVLSDTKKEKKK